MFSTPAGDLNPYYVLDSTRGNRLIEATLTSHQAAGYTGMKPATFVICLWHRPEVGFPRERLILGGTQLLA